MKWGNNFASILVADDFAEWRAGVRSILRARPEWQVIGEAGDGLEAVRRTEEMNPHIVLLDIGMPRLNGIEAAKRMRQVSPGSKIIFVAQENDAEVRIAALATGAEQYVIKANAASELLPAVEAALRDHPVATTLSAAEQESRRA
jgi:DNA-binding NarL/FixJ family response regulator